MVKNLGHHGLKSRYENRNELDFSQEVRKLMALAFVPPSMVASTFDSLIANSKTLNTEEQEESTEIDAFVNQYFQKHYIGKLKRDGTRGKPQFGIDLWNVYESTMAGKYFDYIFCVLFI